MEYIDRFVLSQIDFGTLAILFCLMGVVEGFNKLGYLDLLSRKLVNIAGSYKILQGTLVFACFFISMFVTNDVALIIIVPFTISIIAKIVDSKVLIKIIVLETIAANLGSMVTPIGNPQNLYLYQYYDLDMMIFVKTIMPFVLLAAVILLIIVLMDKTDIKIDKIRSEMMMNKGDKSDKVSQFDDDCDVKKTKTDKIIKTFIYSGLFIISILTVLDVVNYIVCFGIVLLFMLICDRSLLKKINYGLLIKFIILFLIVGNVAEISYISSKLKGIVAGNEFAVGLILSQFISNVPAAIMLSKFTGNGTDLLLGVDIGGFGTIIASMASMISYDYFVKQNSNEKGKYLKAFSMYNIIFLTILVVFFMVLSKF